MRTKEIETQLSTENKKKCTHRGVDPTAAGGIVEVREVLEFMEEAEPRPDDLGAPPLQRGPEDVPAYVPQHRPCGTQTVTVPCEAGGVGKSEGLLNGTRILTRVLKGRIAGRTGPGTLPLSPPSSPG